MPPLAQSGIYRFKAVATQYEIREGSLYLAGTNKPVVRPEQAEQIVAARYKESGLGRDKLYNDLKREYANISFRFINDWLNKNETQQRTRYVARNNPITRPTIVREPNAVWQCDCTLYKSGEAEDVWLFCVIVCFSKFAWVKTLLKRNGKTPTSADTASFMRQIMTPQNHPKVIKSDNGVEFEGDFKAFIEEFAATNGGNPKHIRSGVYVKESQGQVERFNKTIKGLIQCYMLNNSGPRLKVDRRVVDWCTTQYNESLHATTKRRPFSLHDKNRQHPTAKSAAKRIKQAAEKSIKQTQREFPNVSINDTVRVSIYAITPKLQGNRRHGFVKGYIPQWSKEIYTVVKKYGGKFTCRAQDGSEITTVRNQIQLIKQ